MVGANTLKESFNMKEIKEFNKVVVQQLDISVLRNNVSLCKKSR